MKTVKIWFVGLLILTLSGLLLLAVPAAASKPLTLSDAYRIALRSNENLMVLREQLKESEEEVVVATSHILPQLDLRATAVRGRQRQPFAVDQLGNISPDGSVSTEDSWRAEAVLTQPLYRAGQLLSTREIARLRRREIELDNFYQTQQVLFVVASRFYAVKQAEKQVEIWESSLARANKQLARSEALFEQGMITRTPKLRARVQVAEAERELTRANNRRQLAFSQLQLELGGEEIEQLAGVELVEKIQLEKLQEYYQQARRHRRDYLGTVERLEQARRYVEVKLAGRYPSVDLQLRGIRYDEEIAGEDQEWEIMGTVNFPLFSGGRISAEIRQARAMFSQTEAGLSRLRRELKVQVEEAYRQVTTRRGVLRSLQQEVAAARENYQEVAAKFSEGLADAVDVSDANTILNESELLLSTEQFNLQLDLLSLQLAVGNFQAELLTSEL